MSPRSRPVSWITLGLLTAVIASAADSPAPSDAAKRRLTALQFLVGGWKGVGQPQRGSTKDNWTERADWAWNFSGKEPVLVAACKDSRYFRELRIQAGKQEGEFVLTALPADAKQDAAVRFTGKLDDEGRLVVQSTPQENSPSRITVRTVAGGDRLLVLYERPANNGWQRMAEVGATRIGSDFGKGQAQPECVVTGGLGTMPVTHEGKTYYVCCTGCRDLFNDNPAQVLAEYRARKAAEAAKKAEK